MTGRELRDLLNKTPAEILAREVGFANERDEHYRVVSLATKDDELEPGGGELFLLEKPGFLPTEIED